MIQTILVVYGLLYFIDSLFDKWNTWERIAEFGSTAKHKFIYDLCFCRFCLMFHLAWMITILYGAFSSFSFDLVAVPFVVSGLTRLIEKR
jgi:hypothetical protein